MTRQWKKIQRAASVTSMMGNAESREGYLSKASCSLCNIFQSLRKARAWCLAAKAARRRAQISFTAFGIPPHARHESILQLSQQVPSWSARHRTALPAAADCR